jgi:Domain of unknown function (DUF4394)
MNVNLRSLAAAGVMLAATGVEGPTAFAQGACGNISDFPPGPRVVVFGLTDDQRLIRFRECRPGNARDIGEITGLDPADTAIVGIDFRVQDGLLYGLGDGGGIYTIDVASAEATPVDGAALTEELDGEEFDIDFNPAANALRIISDTGQNLRQPFAGDTPFETQVDTDLNIPVPPPGTDPATGVTGVAYTNNDLDPNTGTTLFALSSDTGEVLIQSPPNAGVLVATGALTVDVDADTPVGFDISSVRRRGVIVADRAFAALTVDGASGFYRINPLTGRAILIGDFGDFTVDDIAVRLRQPPSP